MRAGAESGVKKFSLCNKKKWKEGRKRAIVFFQWIGNKESWINFQTKIKSITATAPAEAAIALKRKWNRRQSRVVFKRKRKIFEQKKDIDENSLPLTEECKGTFSKRPWSKKGPNRIEPILSSEGNNRGQ